MQEVSRAATNAVVQAAWETKSISREPRRRTTNRCIVCTLDLLGQTHQKNLGARVCPVVLQVLLRLGADNVVGGLERLQKLGELRVDVRWEDRHGCGVRSSRSAVQSWSCRRVSALGYDVAA